MDLELKDRVVFVAGSTRGIGLAIARVFLDEGARVCISGRNQEHLALVLKESVAEFGDDHVHGICLDLQDAEAGSKARDEIMARWGRIDVLVANIGAGGGTPGWDVSREEWNKVFEINLWASVCLGRAFVSELTARRGNLVFISSIAGVEGIGAQMPYSSAKAALIAFSKNMARDLGPVGVRVNCVAPGNVIFPGGTWDQKVKADPERIENMLTRLVPLQRMASPKEIADVVVFVASPRASFMTGACLVVDGGQTCCYH